MRVRRRRHRDDDAIDQLVAGVGPVVPVEELVGGIGLRADSGIADSLMPARSLARPVPARTVEGRGTPPQMRATEQRPTTGDSASAMTAETVQPFEADVGRVLDLVINSLYKEREIFLRELVSNASTPATSSATPRSRHLSCSTRPGPQDPGAGGRGGGLLTVTDNGVGMSRESWSRTWARWRGPGTSRFVEQLSGDKESDVRLIGQFGVGFYSVFMVADKVVVQSRRAGEDQTWIWASDGRSGFTVQEAETRGRAARR
jgi:hypothetical protein